MKPAAFDYHRINRVDEALVLLAQHGDDARILAGGQSLLPMLNMRLAEPTLLLDISQCAELNHVTIDNETLRIGAATTQAQLEWRDELPHDIPLLAQALPHIAHFQIRNRGTVCGSIAHADPSAELPLCLLALGGDIILRSSRGERIVAAQDFFQGPLLTAREPDELIVAVCFPLAQAGQQFSFTEFSMRHGDYALVSAAAVTSADHITLAIGGVADRPVSQYWRGLSGSALDDALNEFAWSLDSQHDQHASATYRRHLVRSLGKQAIIQATR